MLKINSSLRRLDKGTVPKGSLIDYRRVPLDDKKIMRFNLTHWINQLAKDGNKKDGWMPISGVKNFKYTLFKKCTEEEWDSLNGAGSNEIVEGWLKDILNTALGGDLTETV